MLPDRVKLLDDQGTPHGALLPADLPHRFPSGIVAVSADRDRILQQLLSPRDIVQCIGVCFRECGIFQLRRINDDPAVIVHAVIVFTEAEKIARAEIGIRKTVLSPLRDRGTKAAPYLLMPAQQDSTVEDPVSADKGPDVELLRFQHIQALREALLDPDGGGRPQSEIGHVAVYKKHIPRFAGADRRLALVAYVPVIAGVPQGEPLQDQGDQNDNDKEGQHLYGMRIRPPSARGSRLTFPQRALRLSRCRSPSCNTGGAPVHKGQGV